jgi:hypothetical protein
MTLLEAKPPLGSGGYQGERLPDGGQADMTSPGSQTTVWHGWLPEGGRSD